jgi:CDP-L-myo-inositol myo-inositolphosphotransferase
MENGTVRQAAVDFATAREAHRLVAGVPVAARIVRELALAGFVDVWIVIAAEEPLDPLVAAEIHRLAPTVTLHAGAVPGDIQAVHFPGDRLIAAGVIPDFQAGRAYSFVRLDGHRAAAEILRGTGKASDGVVSRWLNRPISRRLSAVLLQVPGVRPIHATIGTAAIAAAMFTALVFGGHPGLIAGALLFHGASVFDGVDGEVARATFRTSSAGAALDSAIDLATNVAAMLGLAINLSLHGQPEALALVAWSLTLFLLGVAMIGRRSLRETGSISFDVVKHRYRDRFSGPLAARLMTAATLGTSRDFCALVYLVLVLSGIPIAGLYLFAIVTPVWLMFVIAALWSSRGRARATPAGAA